jgi:hypothetical protein
MFVLPPHLDVYYASTCAPCRLELPSILQTLAAGKDIRILIVSDPGRAAAELALVGPKLAQVARMADGKDPRDRLRRAGDADGILPFTRTVAANGRICATWRGALTRLRIGDMLSACR